MASKYYGDLVFSTGEYEKDGETKKRWSKAGAVFRDSETGSISIKFETMPIGIDWSGWMRVFKKDSDSKQTQPAETKDAVPTTQEVDEPIDLSEIPF